MDHPSRCLICYKSFNDSGRDGGRVLEIPTKVLTSYLQVRDGEAHSPDKWIWTCSSCNVLIKEAKKLHGEILKATQRFGEVQKLITEMIKASAEPSEKAAVGNSGHYFKADKVTMESRRFVCNQNYEILIDDPFQQGDWKARQLVIQTMKTSSEIHNPKSSLDIPTTSEAIGREGTNILDLQYEKSEEMQNGEIINGNQADAVGLGMVCEPEDVKVSLAVATVDKKDNGVGVDDSGSEWTPDDSDDPSGQPVNSVDQISRMVKQTRKPGTNGNIDRRRRKFECEICHKITWRSDKHKLHMTTHSNERPYECTQCSYRGKTKGMLNSHRRRHRPPSHKCSLCPKVLSCTYKLTLHYKGVHKLPSRPSN